MQKLTIKYLLILITLVIAAGCTRKVHTEKTEDRSSDTQMHYIDSINKVNRTLSEAYEELLKTTNSTGVVFESTPCDTGWGYSVAVPDPPNKITISPDGTKTFEGNIKSYKDDATKLHSRIFSMQETIDSLKQVTIKDTSHHEQSSVVVVRTIKTTFIPWWIWLIIAGLGTLTLWRRAWNFKWPRKPFN